MKKLLFGFGMASVVCLSTVWAQADDLLGGSNDALSQPQANNTELNSVADEVDTLSMPQADNTDTNSAADEVDTLSLLEGLENSLEENGETTTLDDDNLKSSAGVPGKLPSSTELNFSVINISQGNKDAKVIGARPGDMLMYKFTINSKTEDILDYVSVWDVKSALVALDFNDIGLAELDRSKGTITFPAFTHAAPCEQVFTVYAAVKPDCGDLHSVKISASGETANVTLHCKLAPTGSFSRKQLMYGGILIMLLLAFGFGVRRRV